MPGHRPTADEPAASPGGKKPAPSLPSAFPASLNLQEMENGFIREALRRSGENRTDAAKLLGISRRTLHRKLHELGLIDPAESDSDSAGPRLPD